MGGRRLPRAIKGMGMEVMEENFRIFHTWQDFMKTDKDLQIQPTITATKGMTVSELSVIVM